MKFIVSSTGLFSHLQAISRVINSKNSLPILGCSGISFRASSMVFEETAKRPSPSLSFTSKEVDRVVSLSEAVSDNVPSVSSIKKQSRNTRTTTDFPGKYRESGNHRTISEW